jgi:hypothetical protein
MLRALSRQLFRQRTRRGIHIQQDVFFGNTRFDQVMRDAVSISTFHHA